MEVNRFYSFIDNRIGKGLCSRLEGMPVLRCFYYIAFRLKPLANFLKKMVLFKKEFGIHLKTGRNFFWEKGPIPSNCGKNAIFVQTCLGDRVRFLDLSLFALKFGYSDSEMKSYLEIYNIIKPALDERNVNILISYRKEYHL